MRAGGAAPVALRRAGEAGSKCLSTCCIVIFAAVGGVQTCMLFGKLKHFLWLPADVLCCGFLASLGVFTTVTLGDKSSPNL